jgi:hypothetical protein
MKRKIDWLQFGQYLALVNNLFETVRNEFKKKNIGPEILEWLNGPGKEFFLGILATTAEEFDRFRKRQKVAAPTKPQPLVAEVDLDVEPEAPFNDARLTRHQKQGKVRVEYRPDEDELYVNGRKFIGWLSDEQLAGRVIGGKALQQEAMRHDSCNAAFTDWLYRNQAFIPNKCRGKVWYFWASEWSDSDGNRCVRYLGWDGGKWHRGCGWLGHDWDANDPAASLAS